MKDNSITELILNTISFVAQQQDTPVPERIELIEVLLKKLEIT